MKCTPHLRAALLLTCAVLSAPFCLKADPDPKTLQMSETGLLMEFDPAIPGLEETIRAAKTGDLAATQRAYLAFRRTGSKAKWFKMPNEEPAAAVESDDKLGDEVIAHHIRNVYHFVPMESDMGKDFNWKFNPVSRSEPTFTDEWTYCAVSRTQFWKELYEAYWKTHNEKYAAEWVAEMLDFIAKNPVGVGGSSGPSLWRTLDAAIRMHDSWPTSYYHFLNSPSFTPAAHWKYACSIVEHARFLKAGLANKERTGNWVTTECYGLYCIGVLFPEFKESADWRKTALDRLTSELDRMTPPDGFEVELTPNYHMVSLEGFRGPARLAKLNGIELPRKFHDKVLSMYQAIVLMMDQNGDVTPTNDGGVYNAQRVAANAEEFQDDPLLKWAASKGAEGKEPPLATALPYAGFYAMRGGWKKDDAFLFFRAGPTGTGHYHEDMLEVALHAFGKTMLVDPGNYVYDKSEWRRYSIGTPAHNTIIVDGKWQHRGGSKAPVTEPTGDPWVATPAFDYAAGTYAAGYQANKYWAHEYYPLQWEGEPDKSVSHTRRVLYLPPGCALLLDTLDGTGEHTFDAHFHLDAPSAKVDQQTGVALSDAKGNDPRVALIPLERENLVTDVVQGQKEPTILGWKFGPLAPAPTVRFRKKQAAPAVFATVLYPFRGEAPEVKDAALAVTGANVWSRALLTPQGRMEVAIAKDGKAKSIALRSAVRDTEVKAEAAGLVIRPCVGGTCMAGWEFGGYSDARAEWSCGTPGALVAVEARGEWRMFNGGESTMNVRMTRPFARTFDLPPGVWTEVSASGTKTTEAPELFGEIGSPKAR